MVEEFIGIVFGGDWFLWCMWLNGFLLELIFLFIGLEVLVWGIFVGVFLLWILLFLFLWIVNGLGGERLWLLCVDLWLLLWFIFMLFGICVGGLGLGLLWCIE